MGEVGNPVAQNCSISPLEEDAKSPPEVGNGFTLQLPSVPSKRTPKFPDLSFSTLCQPPKDSATRGKKAIPCCIS